jgi:hypothetical protein
MYPIDLLKVSLASLTTLKFARRTDFLSTDSHASREPYTRRHLHRYRQCHFDHFKSGGLHVIVEGRVKCGARCR